LERVVTMVPFGPSYIAREQDSADCVGANAARLAMAASMSLRRGWGRFIWAAPG
jgi:S-adenosylmethionine:diacylglycerol 3-amino-3-carboxypropyl transferase